MKRERLLTALSPNGTRVHLATSEGQPICGSLVIASCRVFARVTCPGCAKRRPGAAARRRTRPYVIGIDWSIYYATLARCIEAGATKIPKLKVMFLPVLG